MVAFDTSLEDWRFLCVAFKGSWMIETIMLAPTVIIQQRLGKNEVRIAYILKLRLNEKPNGIYFKDALKVYNQ